eukprot:CAMPEP_0174252476 /NCGR_PEP_ID=MMETSP0439-20130205/1931_1 /TAXON_ID=0 /ORGANISM="Stereomyxa ramosa, Strain Chinc5" /LENGTH=1007 /DNA_ID=CAMNT_0015333017 /DNA_START=118 /DNA_END=3141 /DNA_ORIENTATION=+
MSQQAVITELKKEKRKKTGFAPLRSSPKSPRVRARAEIQVAMKSPSHDSLVSERLKGKKENKQSRSQSIDGSGSPTKAKWTSHKSEVMKSRGKHKRSRSIGKKQGKLIKREKDGTSDSIMSLFPRPEPIPTDIPVFGQPLEHVLHNDKAKVKMALGLSEDVSLKIPLVIFICLRQVVAAGLDEEGLFRIAAPKEEQDVLKEYFDCPDPVSLDPKKIDRRIRRALSNVHVCANLLKQFLRELPGPLLTYEYSDQFCSVIDVNVPMGENIRKVKAILQKIPKANYELLFCILLILKHVVLNQNNKMTSDNIGRIFGPNLLWIEGGDVSLEMMVSVNQLTTFMIDNVNTIMGYPSSTLNVFTEPEEIVLKNKFFHFKKSVQSLVTTLNFKYIWGADSAGTITIYDSARCQMVKQIETGTSNILTMIDVEECGVWVGSMDCIQVRHSKTGDLIKEFEAKKGSHSLLSVGNEVWSGGTGEITIYNVVGLAEVQKLAFNAQVSVSSMTQTNTGEVWCAGTDQMIRVYNPETRKKVHEFQAHRRRINTVQSIGDKVWTTSDDKSIIIWESLNYEYLKTLDAHDGNVYDVECFGSKVWSCSWDKQLICWDAVTFEKLNVVNSYHSDGVSTIIGCWNGKAWEMWISSYDHSITVFSINNCDKAAPWKAWTVKRSSLESGFLRQSTTLDLNNRIGGSGMVPNRKVPKPPTTTISQSCVYPTKSPTVYTNNNINIQQTNNINTVNNNQSINNVNNNYSPRVIPPDNSPVNTNNHNFQPFTMSSPRERNSLHSPRNIQMSSPRERNSYNCNTSTNKHFSGGFVSPKTKGAAPELPPRILPKSFLVDFLSTLTNFDAKVVEVFRSRFPEAPQVDLEYRWHYDIVENYPDECKEEVRAIFQEPGFYQTLLPAPGAVQALKGMKEAGMEVLIYLPPLKTMRGANELNEKLEWLSRNFGEEFLENVVLAKNKTLVKCDFVIEAKPLLTNKPKPWQHVIFDQPHNQTIHSDSLRMCNWDWRSVF